MTTKQNLFLITGATGNTGTPTVKLLRDAGHRGPRVSPRHRRPFKGHRQVVDLVWCCQDWSFVAIAARYKGYRYPIEVIGHAVWLYHRFTLSLRDVEELMLARGVVVTYETIR